MAFKSISSVLLVALSLSACSWIGSDKKETASVSPTPKVSKASLQAEPVQATQPSTAAKCDDKGFCPLPGLKKRTKAE